MAVNKRGLGKGLDTMIPPVKNEKKSEKGDPAKGPETLVNITKVEPNREQPRKNFDEDALLELSESIKQYGLLQPILVQDRKDYYEIIAGERRWRAAKLAGLKQVPVIIKNLTDQEIVEISLIENIQRENLNPIEEAQAYKRLLNEFHLKQDEVAERVSKSRTAVTNSMRLLKLSDALPRSMMVSSCRRSKLVAVAMIMARASLAATTSAGIVSCPAMRHAAVRLCPARISYSSLLGILLTMIRSSKPCSRSCWENARSLSGEYG